MVSVLGLDWGEENEKKREKGCTFIMRIVVHIHDQPHYIIPYIADTAERKQQRQSDLWTTGQKRYRVVQSREIDE